MKKIYNIILAVSALLAFAPFAGAQPGPSHIHAVLPVHLRGDQHHPRPRVRALLRLGRLRRCTCNRYISSYFSMVCP